MTEKSMAYAEFWAGRDPLGNLTGGGFINRQTGQLIPAFAQGSQPTPATSFPLIIYPLSVPAEFSNSTGNVAYIYDRRPAMLGFAGLINDVLGQMRAAIPYGGRELFLIDGSSIRLDFVRSQVLRDFDDTTGATMQGLLFFDIRSRTLL